jgi:hypothetical protein
MSETGLWSVEMRGGVFGRLRRVERLESLPPEGTVVDHRAGHAVVRGGVLVALSEQQAEDLVDPTSSSESSPPPFTTGRPTAPLWPTSTAPRPRAGTSGSAT